MRTANIIGSGPNGLAAAITLAQAGVQAVVYEKNDRIGGACSTAELTLPGFHHDLGSSAYPMGVASPFFRSLPLERYGFRWIEPEIPLAHPLDGGEAVALEHLIADMRSHLGEEDGKAWEHLFSPLIKDWQKLVPELLAHMLHLPRHPLAMARFGLSAIQSAMSLASSRFTSRQSKALFAGCAAHSVMPLTAPLSAAVGLILATAGHTTGWPVAAGGAQSLSNALAAHLRTLGGEIRTGILIENIAELEPANATFFDTSASALARIAGDQLTPAFRASLRQFQQGPGAFKVDWALSQAIPWSSEACCKAATVHAGGTAEEIAAAEAAVFAGQHLDNPFILVVQPSVCDPSRAPAGKHVAWGYTHVPNGSSLDRTLAIELQIERYAPGFRDCILARRAHSTAELESWNPNLVGGDLSGGAMTPSQMLLRPTRHGYATSNSAIYLCSASTAPGGGVHGMCGYHAARKALAEQRRS